MPVPGDLVGVERTYISHIERGRTKLPSLDVIRALARGLETTPEDLLTALLGGTPSPLWPTVQPIHGLRGVVMVAVITEVSAGGGFVPEDWIAMTPPRGASANLASFRVRGDCMAPQINAGDDVVVDFARDWHDGSIVLASVGGELVIKRAYKENGHIRLKADAPSYPDIVEGDLQILGVVVKIEKTPH